MPERQTVTVEGRRFEKRGGEMNGAYWVLVDRLRDTMHNLEADLLRQKCELAGFEVETKGSTVSIHIRFKPKTD
jgi:hypothetical protein